MTLFVHHGPRLDALADGVARRLAKPPADPFERVVVAVPTAGIRDWLSRQLALRLGVTANIDMPFPGRFVAAALGFTNDDDDPWHVERLTWSVLDVLDSGHVDVPGWRQASTALPSRRYDVARRIADLFDRYSTNRPQIIQQWRAGIRGDGTTRDIGATGGEQLVGTLPAAMEWQFLLWRAVRERIGIPSVAERLPALIESLRHGAWPESLPRTVEVFGSGALPPAQRDVVRALAAGGDVHVSVLHPSAAWWRRTPPVAGDGLTGRRRFDELASAAGAVAHHPLLRSWGRPAFEAAAALRGIDDAVVVAVEPSPAEPGTLLRHLQADLVADRRPTPYPLTAGDRSIQVHACHGPIRQLEVLRDAIGHLFVDDAGLQPHDVIIVCPDLARFEPFATAVFARGTLPLPLAVSDLSLGDENPVAAALAAVLRAITGRCTAHDVLAVAALEPVRRRLGISDDDLDLFASWTEQLGTTWGVDGRQRAEWIRCGVDAGTWQSALRSLLLGAAMPAPAPRVAFGGVVPHDDVAGDAVASAGKLADLVARLGRVRDAAAGARPIDEWCDTLVDVLGLLCAAHPSESWQLTSVLAAVDDVRRRAVVSGAPSASPLRLDDIRTIVDGIVSARHGRLRLRTGHVTLTGVLPVRHTPAKVVCVLGLDDAVLRGAGPDGDDLLTVRPCVGERERRAERRQLLLDALLAAEHHLIVTFDGNDVTTNRLLPLPVQISELLAAVDDSLPRRRTTAESPVLVRHPRRAYDERDFDVGQAPGGSNGLGFDDAMLRAAETRRAAVSRAAASYEDVQASVRRWDVGTAVPTQVSIDQLAEACTRPARTLIREGVDARLPGEIARLDPQIPIGIDRLRASELGRRLLAELRDHAAGGAWDDVLAATTSSWLRAARLLGSSPPRRLGEQALADVADDVGQLVTAAAAAAGLSPAGLLTASGHVDVDLAIPYRGVAVRADRAVAGSLQLLGRVDGVSGRTICRLGYVRPKPREHLRAALELAAAVATTGEQDWRAVVALRPQKSGKRPTVHVIDVAPGLDRAAAVDAALAALVAAAEVRVAALRNAVPVFERTTFTLYAKRVLDEELLFGNFDRGDLEELEAGFVWSGISSADLQQLDPSPAALAELIWGSIDAFARIDGKPIRE